MKKSVFGIILGSIVILALVWFVTKRDNSPAIESPQTNMASDAEGSGNSVPAGAVQIRGMLFTPSQVTVQKGATVTWTNNGSTVHTVDADLKSFSSGDIQPGQTFSYTFNKSGSYQYHCSIHPSMRGTIVVR